MSDGGGLDPARVRIERVVVIATDEFGAQDTLRLAIRVVPSIFVGADHVATHGPAPGALYGSEGEDRLIDRHGRALLAGGSGDDSYVLARDSDNRPYGQVLEAPGGGYDTIAFTGTAYSLPDNVERLLFHGTGEQRDRIAVGNALDNAIVADDGGGSIYGLAGDDRLTGGFAGGGLYGGDGNDTLIAASSRNLLSGGIGNDVLYGENALEYGGAGADRFMFRYGTGVTEIYDFSVADGDLIDLRAIDADRATPRNDAFRFIGTTPFTGEAGEIRYVFDDVGETTTVQGDTDGDKSADFSITLPAIPTLHSTDFVL